ncbi:hypothetical protein [Microbacterium sp. cf046]|uniref:hypothetical protein n=1 Tax=Microbacterium sp. cf046 TaxID=1761803 RepID=UPI0011144BAA|nr:hypothetical protein [Microbacterium sp. cf046]
MDGADDATDDVRRIVLPNNHAYYEDTLEVILAEAVRSRGVVGGVMEGMRQRATLLAGTASIAASISADPKTH